MNRLPHPHRSGLAAVVIAWAYALLPANLIPTVIARLVDDHGMDVTTAGFLATGMTLLNSATVLLLRPWVRRHSRARVAIVGAVVLMTVAAVGILFPDPRVYSVLLLIAGVGSGMVLAAASAAISATEDPDRSASVAMIFNRLIVAIAYFTVPLIGGSMTAVLLVLGIPGLVVLATARWLPSVSRSSDPAEQTVAAGKAGLLAWTLAISFGAWSITDDGIVGLSELIAIGRFGDEGSPLVLNLLAVATLGGLVGAVLARPLERLLGRVPAISIALGISLVSKVLMVLADSTILFSVVFVGWGFAFGLSLPLVFGLAAVMKRDGSASVAVNGVYILGVALGPMVASQFYNLGEEPLLAIVMGVLGTVSALAIIVIAARIGKNPDLAEAEEPTPHAAATVG